jgi:hypothetical protein
MESSVMENIKPRFPRERFFFEPAEPEPSDGELDDLEFAEDAGEWGEEVADVLPEEEVRRIRGPIQRGARRQITPGTVTSRLHTASRNFPDPENCYLPGSKGKPNWSKTIVSVEATLEIPIKCGGLITTKTTLRDVEPGGASGWAEFTRFGVSDGTHTGALEKLTKVVAVSLGTQKGSIDFEQTIKWNGQSCSAKNDLFVYVKLKTNESPAFTFIEVGYYPRIMSDGKGHLIDKSPPPKIRLDPCDNLKPIRRVYIRGGMSQRYQKLSAKQREAVTKETGRRFRNETGVSRKLRWDNIKDRLLARQWLHIRDEVIAGM